MRVTVKQIAARCGVSRETVNHILNGRGKFKPDTRERVLATAQELGYRPNSAARAMRFGKFGALGVVASSFHPGLSMNMLLGVEHATRGKQSLVFGRYDDDALTDTERLPRIASEWNVDGLLVSVASKLPLAISDLFHANRLPMIWLNVKQDVDCIHPDDYGAAREAVSRLHEIGHRRIAYLSFAESMHFSVADRRQGYLDQMKEAGLPVAVQDTPVPWHDPQSGKLAAQVLREHTDWSAIVTYSDYEAFAFLYAAASLGLRVPQDLSLICLGPERPDAIGRAVSCLMPDFYAMGMQAVELLNRRIEKPKQPLPSQVIKAQWLPGSTMAPPSSSRRK